MAQERSRYRACAGICLKIPKPFRTGTAQNEQVAFLHEHFPLYPVNLLLSTPTDRGRRESAWCPCKVPVVYLSNGPIFVFNDHPCPVTPRNFINLIDMTRGQWQGRQRGKSPMSWSKLKHDVQLYMYWHWWYWYKLECPPSAVSAFPLLLKQSATRLSLSFNDTQTLARRVASVLSTQATDCPSW